MPRFSTTQRDVTIGGTHADEYSVRWCQQLRRCTPPVRGRLTDMWERPVRLALELQAECPSTAEAIVLARQGASVRSRCAGGASRPMSSAFDSERSRRGGFKQAATPTWTDSLVFNYGVEI